MAPVAIPAFPTPATKRPTMNMAEEVAAPQRIEPISNTAKKVRKARCAGQESDSKQKQRIYNTNLGTEVLVDPPC